MRAITITRHGGPEVLEITEHPDPDPKSDEVRVRVKACGLNFAELMARQGLYPDAPKPPCVVGYEAAGVIDAVGADVEEHEVGDRVLVARKFGTHADTVCIDQRMAFEMPEAMSFEEAAAIPVNYLTAYHMLFRVGNVRPKESVLIHMAAGGVGIAALQLCKTVEGLTTFGTASPGKHPMIRDYGCDHPIDYRSLSYADEVRRLTDGKGVDLILDALGGKDWKEGYNLLRPVGRLIAFGFANMATGDKRNLFNIGKQMLSVPRWSPMSLMEDNRTIAGVNMGHLFGEIEMLSGHLVDIIRLYEEGIVKPHVDSTFTFDKVADAHRHMQDRKNVGKIVLTPT